MNAEQLKLLAPHVRGLLGSPAQGVEISHGQALDLTAALVGLRNWPEVLAFPKRVQACDIDLAAAERLIERIYTKFGDRMARYPHRLKAESVLSRLAPWKLDAPRDPALRERLVIASGDSACGCLKQAGIADAVLMALYSFVTGPVPLEYAEDPAAFFETRMAAWDADPQTSDQPEDWQRERESRIHMPDWSDQLSRLAEYERIELWLDPGAEGQLQLLRLLDWLGNQPSLLYRVFLMHPAQRLGDCTPYMARQMDRRLEPATSQHFHLASRAWKAFMQATPEGWAALLKADLSALPALRPGVLHMLEELPAVDSGLRWSERRLLEVVSKHQLRPPSLIAELLRSDRRRTFGYWETGRLLDGLARGPMPALQGLDEGPFDLELHDDEARFKRYMNSRLSLTDFGRALLEGKVDWAAHTSLRFWWGGTKLTPENLWRWDAANERLAAP